MRVLCSVHFEADSSGPYFPSEPSWGKNRTGFRWNSWIKIKNFANPVPVRGNSGVHKAVPYVTPITVHDVQRKMQNICRFNTV
jgi:hypothetical protein